MSWLLDMLLTAKVVKFHLFPRQCLNSFPGDNILYSKSSKIEYLKVALKMVFITPNNSLLFLYATFHTKNKEWFVFPQPSFYNESQCTSSFDILLFLKPFLSKFFYSSVNFWYKKSLINHFVLLIFFYSRFLFVLLQQYFSWNQLIMHQIHKSCLKTLPKTLYFTFLHNS